MFEPTRAPERTEQQPPAPIELRSIEAAPERRFYLRVRTRFLISVVAGLAWVLFSRARTRVSVAPRARAG